MSYIKNSPDAPTRLAEHATAEDCLQTQVYYIGDSDVYLTVDNQGEPTSCNAVVVGQLPDGRLIVEPFCGQKHFGVVRVLRRLYPTHLDWWLAGL